MTDLSANEAAFPAGGGEMGQLIRHYDWTTTPLGIPGQWSCSLRSLLQMMLANRFPSLIFWGPDLITFYNDAFRPSLGNDGKHPGSLGQPGQVSWAESWPVIGPLIRGIMAGQDAVWFEDQKLPIYREGAMGYAYWTYSFSPLTDDDGSIAGVLVTCSETTSAVENLERLNQTNQTLNQLLTDKTDLLLKQQETELTLQTAVDQAELAIWRLDMASREFVYSERLRDWCGFIGEETQYSTGYNPILELQRAALDKAMAYAMTFASGGDYDEQHSVIDYRSGELRVLRMRGKALFDPTGQLIKLTGTAQNITPQWQTQLDLEQLVQQRTESLAASNEELTANNEALAATNEELAATNEELAASSEELTASNEELFTTIEKLEESNNLLLRSNENMQQFTYIASHDLQEPLRKIQQFSDLLKKRLVGVVGDEELNYLERVNLAAGRMSTLVRDLLRFSRISTQRDTSAPVSLDQVLSSVLTVLDLAIEQANANVIVQPLPFVAGDMLQLSQLFQNLLSNALKFSRPGVQPHITVGYRTADVAELPEAIRATRRSDRYYRIEVADNGIGFEEKYLDRIFQVFQRLHGKNSYEGTGIGLAICQKVAVNHGGIITAVSQPGQGATFILYLPAN